MHLITFKDTISPEQRDVGFVAGEKQDILVAYNLRYAGQDTRGRRYYWNPAFNSDASACIYVYVENFCDDNTGGLPEIICFEQMSALAKKFREYCS